jgi:hypothetical protein
MAARRYPLPDAFQADVHRRQPQVIHFDIIAAAAPVRDDGQVASAGQGRLQDERRRRR